MAFRISQLTSRSSSFAVFSKNASWSGRKRTGVGFFSKSGLSAIENTAYYEAPRLSSTIRGVVVAGWAAEGAGHQEWQEVVRVVVEEPVVEEMAVVGWRW
jgi:hypothetical protein